MVEPLRPKPVIFRTFTGVWVCLILLTLHHVGEHSVDQLRGMIYLTQHEPHSTAEGAKIMRGRPKSRHGPSTSSSRRMAVEAMAHTLSRRGRYGCGSAQVCKGCLVSQALGVVP